MPIVLNNLFFPLRLVMIDFPVKKKSKNPLSNFLWYPFPSTRIRSDNPGSSVHYNLANREVIKTED